MSNPRHRQHHQNFLVVLGREWRDGRFDPEPPQCLKKQINNNTLIISTPDVLKLKGKHMLDLMALTNPGPNLFLLRLEEGKQPDEELGKWQKVFGEYISHNMIYITDRPYDDSRLSGKCISIKEHIIEGCEHIINKDNHTAYSFGEFLKRRRKQIEYKMEAEMETDQHSHHQYVPSPVPDGQQKSPQLNLVPLREPGSGKRKQSESKMAAEMDTDQFSSPQDFHNPVPGMPSRPTETDGYPDQSSHQNFHRPAPGDQQKRRQLNLVLLGEYGSGKSASGNTILGMKAFKSEPSSMPVTTECETQTRSICGTEVTVIDTPDFFDDDSLQEQSRHIQRCGELCKGGLCVYLLVIQIGRFTDGERDILERLEKALNAKVRDRAIILFTRGDDLRSNIDEYVRDTNPFLQKLIKDCGGRYQVFNNTPLVTQQSNEKGGKWYQLVSKTTSHKTEVDKQVKELMKMTVNVLSLNFCDDVNDSIK